MAKSIKECFQVMFIIYFYGLAEQSGKEIQELNYHENLCHMFKLSQSMHSIKLKAHNETKLISLALIYNPLLVQPDLPMILRHPSVWISPMSPVQK